MEGHELRELRSKGLGSALAQDARISGSLEGVLNWATVNKC